MARLACLGAILLLSTACAAVDRSADLVGVWQLFKDDDSPDGPITEETISFWPSEKFSISGNPPHQGIYRVRGGELQFFANIGEKGLWISRAYRLHGEELALKNIRTGWAYYRRTSLRPKEIEPPP